MFRQELERVTLGMPQLGPCGLSENWLLRYIGDVHWQIICDGVGRPSRDMVDQAGNRLYASFARVCWSSTLPLSQYRESDDLEGSIEMVRCGDGIFFSTSTLRGATGGEIQLRLASIFTRREGATNDRLVASIPVFEKCTIPDVSVLPPFLEEHRQLRNGRIPVHTFMGMDFDTDIAVDQNVNYLVNGYNDLNGARLLYFASYPTIADICGSRTHFVAQQFGFTNFVLGSSPLGRDSFYFGNADLGDWINCGFKLRHLDPNTVSARVDLVRSRDSQLIGKQFVVRETPPGATML